MDFRIVVDSCCELVDELKEFGVKRVPLTMRVGDLEFRDDENLDLGHFTKVMNSSPNPPTSSCPSPAEYADIFKESNKTTFVVTLSNKLSGSYNSANLAKSMVEEEGYDVHVFDSKSASAGEILVALKIKELIEKGLPKAAIIEKVEHFINNMRTFFVLENLNTLVKNGRINKIVAGLAQVLNIRAVLGSDDGNISFFARARGAKMAVEKLLDMIKKYGEDTKDKILVVTHCNNHEYAKMLCDKAKELFNFKKIYLAPTGGLSSMYANEGGIIIAF